MNKLLLNKYDVILIIIYILITISISVYIFLSNIDASEKTVEIKVNGNIYKEVSLDIDRTIEINNSGMENIIKIENGSVYMEYANCPDKICTHEKPINNTNQIIACVPNKVTIDITGEKSDIDGFSR